MTDSLANARNSATWHDRSVLITGIGGFVGSSLAQELLVRGAKVVGIVRDRPATSLLKLRGIDEDVSQVFGSITDHGLMQRALNEYEVDTVFHLGAQGLVGVANRSPVSTFESNVAGTWTVLEAVRMCPGVRRVVVASSDKAYGEQSILPYREDSPLLARYPYDASKACADIISHCYEASFELPVTVLRCANIYGPGDLNWSRLVPGTIRSALCGQRPVVRSDGSPERDYLYLSDAVDGYLRAADGLPSNKGEAFNMGSGKPISVLQLINEILQAMGVEELKPVVLAESSGEIDRQYLDSAKAERRLGWSVQVDLAEGLQRTVEWYRDLLSRNPVAQVRTGP